MLLDKRNLEDYAKKNGMPSSLRDILREFLQVQIMNSLSQSKYSDTISFLGGTALRFGHNIKRFSEDLDFDLVKKKDFSITELEMAIKKDLESQGFVVDSKAKTTENIHIIYWKFSGVLRTMGFPVQKDEKFLIKFEIDFDPQKAIETEVIFMNKFDLKFPILFNNIATIYSQKIFAIMFRPYQKGRDFYDLFWFITQRNLEPNYKLLQEKGIQVKNRAELIAVLQDRLKKIDLNQAAVDVRRFLFDPREAEWIKDLPKYLESAYMR